MTQVKKINRAALTLEFAVGIETAATEKMLERFISVLGKDVQKELSNQSRLLIRDMAKGTPPFTSRDSSDESWLSQRKVGEKAVRRDIMRTFRPIEDIAAGNDTLGTAIMLSMGKNVSAGPGSSLPELLFRAGILDSADPTRILESPNLALHLSARKNRGRVPWNTRPYFVKNKRALERYIKDAQKMVGKAKGGWVVGAERFGLKLPAWITRHKGGVVDDKSGIPINPFVVITNNVHYMGYLNQVLYTTLNALKDRRVAMQRQINAYVDKRTKEANE